MAECTENKIFKKFIPKIYKILEIHSVITIPLVSSDDLIGLMELSRSDHFKESDTHRLEIISEQMIAIIQRNRAEEKIKKLTVELEQRVKARTTELEQAYEQLKTAQEQFYQAQKMESVGVLAGGIAHDFNNFLATIMGNISLAKMMTKPEDKIFNILTRVENVSRRAKDLTQQLLTFSKGGVPGKKIISISQIIRDSVNIAQRGSKISCEFSLPDNIWPVEVDEAQLSQVINNLIINADQAMPEGGKIKVCTENVKIKAEDGLPLGAGNYVRISIQDQGIGISEENLAKVFDPFFTTKPTGTGLGLTTVYSIIKKHNGHISVESKIGVGSTFHIYLPSPHKEILVRRGQPVSDSFLGKEKPEDFALSEINGKGRILIMDDEKGIQETLETILTHFGYAVECAREGTETINLYKKAKELGKSFDAVIMDLTIRGGMGGKETIKKLLKIDPKVKAIVSSGYSNDPIMTDFRKFGFSGVIAKPYQVEDLIKTLQEMINGNE
jgi:signal transduction histidine kinase/ActR/RegA family two-component response regulator